MVQSSIYADPTNSATQQYTFYQPFYQSNTWVTSTRTNILINYTQHPLQAREGYVEEQQLNGVSPYAVIQCKNGVDPASRCHMMPL